MTDHEDFPEGLDLDADPQLHFMVVEARFYDDIADMLLEGVKEELDKHGVSYEVITVPGALELPGAIKMAIKSREVFAGRRRFDGYIALGTVIRGATSHYDYVCSESMRGLNMLVMDHSIALGNGILTCENKDQAIERADKNQKNKGGYAAQAALAMINIKKYFGMFPR